MAIISTRFDLTPSEAWSQGTNVRTAFKHEPKLTHISLMALLKDAVDYLEMNKSFRHEGDYIEAVTYLIEQFPAMKVEEWKIIMTRLKAGYFGKMYERLKLPELVEMFQQFEGERAEMREKEFKREKDNYGKEQLKPLSKEQQELWDKFMDDLDLPEEPVDEKGRWKHIHHPNVTDEQSNKE